MRRALVLVCAGGLFAGLITTPARATIEKIMNQCDHKMCPFFRASIVIPDGWVEDKDATRYFNSQFLLPKGVDFEKEMAEIDSLFPYGLIMLPTPEEMGVTLPAGLRVQAFRHGDEVIVRRSDFHQIPLRVANQLKSIAVGIPHRIGRALGRVSGAIRFREKNR